MRSTGFSLTGRVAFVTGTARGIGRAIAEALAQRGVPLMIADAGVDIGGNQYDPSVADALAQ